MLTGSLFATAILLLGACSSDPAQVVAASPTTVATTAPIVAATATPTAVPTLTPVPLPEATATPVPPPTAVPTEAPAVAAEAAPAPTAAPETAPVEAVETPTAVPTPTVEEPSPEEAAPEPTTPPAETPSAVPVISGEPPLECFDRDVQLYRGFVEGVDTLAFEGGTVYCSGAGTNGVSAAASYRHSTGLIVQRNGDFILDNAGTGYINYSGAFHFCVNGQAASAPFRANTVPELLIVIDSEAQRHVAEGATAPTSFSGSGAQC